MLKETISNDLKKALKEKNELVLLVLRGVASEIHNKEIERKREELTEEDILSVLMGEAKKRKDAIIEFKKGAREDLAKKEEEELEILKKYLPEQMGEDQIREEAKKIIEEVGAVGPQDTGSVMGSLMPKLKGKTDGNVVNKIVGELLKSE